MIVILCGWYFFSMTAVKSNLKPSTNNGLNDSSSQINTDKTSDSSVIKVSSDPKLGNYITATNGMTLYSYAKDTLNTSNCYDMCASNWPPYSPLANESLVSNNDKLSLFSTITRTDGSIQLVYKGVPLYFWKNDSKPGDTTGQNVGGVWFVVKP